MKWTQHRTYESIGRLRMPKALYASESTGNPGKSDGSTWPTGIFKRLMAFCAKLIVGGITSLILWSMWARTGQSETRIVYQPVAVNEVSIPWVYNVQEIDAYCKGDYQPRMMGVAS